MKICFCIGRLSFSGGENVVRYLVQQLMKRNHDVSVILTEKMPDETDNIECIAVENAIVREGGFINAIRRIRAERTALKKLQPDIFIIFNSAMAFTAIPATFGLQKLKVIVSERNDPTFVPNSRKRKIARDFLFRFVDVCVSQTYVISSYFERFIKNCYVIPNPVRDKVIMCKDILQRKKVFVTVARLDDQQKNQTMMIKGFAQVVNRYPDYELHFLGDGLDMEKYKKLALELGVSGCIKFLGNHPKPLDYIRDCRVFLLTSNYEGIPNSLMEAMSIGLPCIATDCHGGGSAFLIQNGENGILISRENINELIKNMILLIDDDDLCNRLGKKAYEINEYLDGDLIVGMWEEMIINTINGNQ